VNWTPLLNLSDTERCGLQFSFLYALLVTCLLSVQTVPAEYHIYLLVITFLYSVFLEVFIPCHTAVSLGLKILQEAVLRKKLFTATGNGQQPHSFECEQYDFVYIDVLLYLREK